MAEDEPLARLRVRPRNLHPFKGFGPFVAALVLFALMLVLAPSVAPERVVERAKTDTSPITVAPDELEDTGETTTTASTTTTVAP